MAYLGIAGLLTELKRTHLSAAADDITTHYAEKEVNNLEQAAHGISQGISGPSVSTSSGASLGYGMGGLNASAGGAGGRVFFADDSRDIDFWTSYGGFIKGGLGGKISGWAAEIGASLGVNAGGTSYEHDDLRELVKLVSNLDANKSWIKSAGPRARKLVSNVRNTQNAVSHVLLGRNYTAAPGQPYYLNDAKLAKGFNTVKMELLARALDNQLGGRQFTDIVQTAYPAIGRVLKHRIDNGEPLPIATRRDVPDAASYGDGKLPFRQTAIGGEASAGNGTEGGTALEAGYQFAASLKGDVMQFFVETAQAAHQLLDPAYHKDLQATFGLHRQLDSLCIDTPPQLHLYDEMRQALGPNRVTSLPTLSAAERAQFGNAASIPAQFHEAIARPNMSQLARTGQAADRLAQLYTDFTDEACPLLARPDRFMPRTERKTLTRMRTDSFRRVNERVWGGNYPGGLKAALKRPEEFISRSHGGISLALGCVGTHLAVIKQQMATRPTLQFATGNNAAITAADASYQAARDLLDRVYLPMKRYDVQKNGPLKDSAVWQRWNAALKLNTSGGAKASALDSLLGRADLSLGQVSIANEAGQVTLSGEAKYQYADRQPNPGRIGQFLQITLTARGGAPLLGSAMNKAIMVAVEKLNAGIKTEAAKVDASEAMRQIQGLVLDVADGTSVVIKLRKAPGIKSLDLQYIRGLSDKAGGLNSSIEIPTPVGKFTPGVLHADSSQGFAFEVMGPDLSYLMMQHPKLAELMAHATPDNPQRLRQLLDETPRIRDGYFGSRNTILDVVQRYATYLDRKAEASSEGRLLGGENMINEFQRYYSSEPFARVAEVAREVARHAPGSSVKGTVPLSTASRLDEMSIVLPDLQAARRRLQETKTVEERADYYCNEGRPLLEAFAAIVGNTREINAAAMFHTASRSTGFSTKLRDSELRRQAIETQTALDGRSASGWKDAAKSIFRTRAANKARELPLEQLRTIANHPHAKREVKAELRRREKLLPRVTAATENHEVIGEADGSTSFRSSGEIRSSSQQETIPVRMDRNHDRATPTLARLLGMEVPAQKQETASAHEIPRQTRTDTMPGPTTHGDKASPKRNWLSRPKFGIGRSHGGSKMTDSGKD